MEPSADPAAVDEHLAALFTRDAPEVETGDLPAIDVSPPQGKLLHLLARLIGARRILELGTLAGYSTLWLARALPDGGEVVSLEVDPGYAEVARANVERAGLGSRVDIRVGPAIETLPQLTGPFDLLFLDADKRSNPEYLGWALRLSRPGSLIVVDNVVRNGAILDPPPGDEASEGSRRVLELLAAEPRLSATAIQTVGSKGWDGFALAVVNP